MIQIDKRKMGRFTKRYGWMVLTFCLLAGFSSCAGCSKSYIRVNLGRPGNLGRPVWVGVYFLSQESVLDNTPNTELSDPEWTPEGPGVEDKEVFPIYPGGNIRQIVREKYNPSIRWVVVAAGFPEAKPCARQKIPVKEGAKLTITVTAAEECIQLEID
ncbi:hypothetical protein ACFL6M_07675 [Candidatus Eisenbacteria bacterium]|uniref:Uncharacterized protein n=1 Tax=Eiseniibacteriota bacterium TaxID=2212470 RepID=A0ABV6YMP5_UNCEI